MPPDEAKPGFDLGNLGPAHRHTMRRRAVELDDRAITFLANQGDVRHCHDMAAVHPDEQTWVELRLGLRDRPRTHSLSRAVVDLGVVGVGADTPDVRGVDEVGAVGTLDRQPSGVARSRGLMGAALASVEGTSILAMVPPGTTATASTAGRTFLRGSGTSDSRKPAAITKQSSVTTSESICDDAASPSMC